MRRQHVTTAVTLLVLCGILAAGAVYGWRALFEDLPGEETLITEPEPTCTTRTLKAGQRLRAPHVVVSVFNASTRAGLAGSTLESLAGRGFVPGTAGNAPADTGVARVQVWTTVPDDPEARLVARQFGRRTRVVVTEQDLGPGVDVIVGPRLQGLVRAPRRIELRADHEVCVPTEQEPEDAEADA